MTFLKTALAALLLALVASGAGAAALIKVATVSPAGSSWMQTMQQAADTIARRSEGRVRLRFYPGGVMGNDATVFRKMRLGQLQGAAVASGALTDIYTDIQAYSLPMLFENFEAVDYVRERLDQTLIRELERAGMVSFGVGEGGFAYIMSDSPIRTPADLRRKKAWVPSGDPVTQGAIQSFNIPTIPLALADVLPALQTGLVDTVAISPIGALALQWHTRIKYITDLPLLYVYAVLAVEKRSFDRLSAADQQILREEMGTAFERIDRRNRADNIAALQALLNQGIELVRPDAAATAQWRELAAAAREAQLRAGAVSPAMYRSLGKHLADWRAQR